MPLHIYVLTAPHSKSSPLIFETVLFSSSPSDANSQQQGTLIADLLSQVQ